MPTDPTDLLDSDRWDAAQEGAELLREGEADAAIAELERVLEADPRNPYGFHFLGAAHFEKSRFDKALKAYLSAVQLAPNYLGALVGVGHTLRMLGRHQDAMRVARQLLARSATDGDALYLMGLSHYSLGQGAAAAEYFERFLSTSPEMEVANEVSGLLQVLRGNVERDTEAQQDARDRALN